jgi:protein-tyrosine phosphatase
MLPSFASVLSFTGAPNFRDLGGYRTADGLTVRRFRLLRSDHLGALTAEDARQMAQLGLRRVFDLRGVVERATAMCALPDVTVHSLAIEPTIVQVLADLTDAGHELTQADVVAHMQDTYRGFVRENSHRFATLFTHLLESNEPLVFHCTAGKDRTGFAAALILHALGVPQDEVMRDYLLTNGRLKPKSEWRGLAPEVASVLYRVQPEFLNASFEAVQQDFGGVEGYLREALSLGPAERERLRELYLDPGSA